MRSTSPRLGRRLVALSAAAVVIAPLTYGATVASAAPQLGDGEQKTYIVQLADKPLVAYDGGVRGLAATKPGTGQKLDADSSRAQAYANHLQAQRENTLDTLGVSADRLVAEYQVSFNGMAVKLTQSEAMHLKRVDGVVNVWEDEVRYADTVQTPDYLGLRGEGGVWDAQFGGPDNAGAGIVVGVIDTGIDPNNPSFAADGIAAPPDTWAGECAGGTDTIGAITCNNKLVGARVYGEEYGNDISFDFPSVRDANGHGSHTASTAAGNDGVELVIGGNVIGEASGMAPQAHIAAYKGLWQTEDGQGSGSLSGLVAAIDDAVFDGVDVINYSVSGSSDIVLDPVEVSFLFAADAGIFVSTSAGNSGDTVGVSSVAHNAPWTMTVAASTHNRGAENSITLGNGTSYEGVGYGGPLEGPMVNGEDIPAPDFTEADADLCAPGSLDDAGAAGNIVVCTRGAFALVDKGQEVADSGGIGMVLINDPAGAAGQNAIFYAVPAIHLLADDGAEVKAYVAATEAPTGAISATTNSIVNAPEMASFSSFGPALAGGGDLLKPDITAPGVDIAAAYAADLETGESSFDQISGTSMSAPHIAGLGALLKQTHPDWSPAAIKSAMMTTARQTDDADNPIQRLGADATPLDYGAGEVQPGPSYDVGLVYDAGWDDWLHYACALGELTGCPEQIDASDLNYPTIAIGALAGNQTVTRTVTSVSDVTETYTADVEAPPGVSVTVEPSTITVAPGATATFQVTFVVGDTATTDTYAFGALTWTSEAHTVRSAIAVQPSALAADAEVTGYGSHGTLDTSVVPGATGTFNTTVDGLVPSDVTLAQPVSDGPAGGASVADALFAITVPADTSTLRIAFFDEEISVPGTDMDLFLATAEGVIIAVSGTAGSDESITLEAPPAGDYLVAIDYWSGAAGATADVPTHIWMVPDTDEGNLTVTPSTFAGQIGVSSAVTLDWAGLAYDTRYLGAVNYDDGTDVVARTLVNILPGVDRWFGADRFETAAAIAAQYPEGADTVYIATGGHYADALTGAAAAAATGTAPAVEPDGSAAPVLLTHVDSIPEATAAALAALAPTNVKILGGTAVVSQAVENQLAATYAVERIAGADRYGTAAAVAMRYPADAPRVFVASGTDFADALTGAALAGSQTVPVLLTRPDSVPSALTEALAHFTNAEVVVLGGSAAVSDSVYTAIGADRRIAGADRYATAALIAQEFGIDIDAPNVLVTSGANWPDALAGSAYAGAQGIPVLLTRPGAVPAATMTELDSLSPQQVTLLGGDAAIGFDVEITLNGRFADWLVVG